MNEQRSDRKAVHIGSKRLIAYRQGTLPPAEREAVQEHLSLCARCTGLLRELREFEAATAEASTGPDPLREQAWESLVRRLPPKTPAIRPVDGAVAQRPEKGAGAPRSRFVYAAAAALLLAVGGFAGMATWESTAVERLERRLDEREKALAAVRRSEEETRRRLDAAQARIRDLESKPAPDPGRTKREAELADRVAELTSQIGALRQPPRAPQERIAAVSGIEVSLSPRFVLRGAESPGGDLLLGGGAVNRVKAEAGRVTVALDLSGFSTSPEVRFELADRTGRVLWSGRRPIETLAGDDGTLVAIQGLAPGRYRLRIASLPPDAVLRAEYLLDVEE